MKIVLRYAFFAAFLSLVACGNTKVEKEKTVEKASTMVKADPNILVENKATKEVKPEMPVANEEMPKEAVPTTKPVPANSQTKPKVVKVTPKKEVNKEPAPTKVTPPPPTEVTVPTSTQPEKKAETVKEIVKPTAPKQEVKPAPAPAKEVKPTPPAFTHESWNQLAQKHISSTGKVNYKGFKADLPAFEAYLKSLSDNPIQNNWSRAKKMAYWINAYNAFTIKLIVDNYPVSKITDLHGGKPWDAKWIKLGGKTYSLNNIEHDILRPQFKDARIHFAVNCAAQSCPPVWNKAWTAKNLNGQLERSSKSFINNSKYNNVNAKEVNISKIFDWYKEDFGNIIEYLNKYSNTKIDGGAAVKYKEYNWALNE